MVWQQILYIIDFNDCKTKCDCIVIAAAGNDGADGAFYISSPGSGLQTVAVASVDNEYNLQQSILAAEGTEYRKSK